MLNQGDFVFVLNSSATLLAGSAPSRLGQGESRTASLKRPSPQVRKTAPGASPHYHFSGPVVVAPPGYLRPGPKKAQSLLRAAGLFRGRGQMDKAMIRYLRVAREYPATREGFIGQAEWLLITLTKDGLTPALERGLQAFSERHAREKTTRGIRYKAAGKYLERADAAARASRFDAVEADFKKALAHGADPARVATGRTSIRANRIRNLFQDGKTDAADEALIDWEAEDTAPKMVRDLKNWFRQQKIAALIRAGKFDAADTALAEWKAEGSAPRIVQELKNRLWQQKVPALIRAGKSDAAETALAEWKAGGKAPAATLARLTRRLKALKKMTLEFSRTKKYAQGSSAPGLKAVSWESFLSDFKAVIPGSHTMREHAQKRMQYWKLESKKAALAAINSALQAKDFKKAKRLVNFYRHMLEPTITITALHRYAEGLTWLDPVTWMEFVKVPGGSFEMGCHAKAGECYRDERPTRTVRLDGFWLGKHEVTQGEWKRIMGNNPSYFKKGDNYPVEQVSWNDVQQFIRRLNRQSSAKFRLPSEAQWEYACRAGGKSVAYGFGNGQVSSGNANFGRNNGGTTPVERYQANSLGLHDMSGNVWEWVQDEKTSYSNVGTDNPIYERSGSNRVFRGGGWFNYSRYLQCSDRDGFGPSIGNAVLGFRLVRMR